MCLCLSSCPRKPPPLAPTYLSMSLCVYLALSMSVYATVSIFVSAKTPPPPACLSAFSLHPGGNCKVYGGGGTTASPCNFAAFRLTVAAADPSHRLHAQRLWPLDLEKRLKTLYICSNSAALPASPRLTKVLVCHASPASLASPASGAILPQAIPDARVRVRACVRRTPRARARAGEGRWAECEVNRQAL